MAYGVVRRYRAPARRYARSSRGAAYPRHAVPRPVARAPGLRTQLSRLLQGQKRDAADVTQYNAAAMTTTTVGCITSSTAVATAASTSGLIEADADRGSLNTLRICGFFEVDPVADGVDYATVRILLVDYIKAFTNPSAPGTLPAVTDCLVTDAVHSLPLSDAANSGRFRIMYDKVFNVGRNSTVTATAGFLHGPIVVNFDEIIPLNVVQHYAFSAKVGTASGGHFDSDTTTGQVDKHLVCLYVLTRTPATLSCTMVRRLNYTA